jgi:hypothetical protein
MDEEDCAWLRLVDGVVCEIWRSVRHFASSDQKKDASVLGANEELGGEGSGTIRARIVQEMFPFLMAIQGFEYYGLVISYNSSGHQQTRPKG